MINAPARTEADVARTASAPKRPWEKPTIRKLRIASTRTGSKMNPALDEDDTTDANSRAGYAPIS